jgi:hypothetical protein
MTNYLGLDVSQKTICLLRGNSSETYLIVQRYTSVESR